MQTPIEYLRSKSVEYREQSGQIVLKTCPSCGDEKWHCYISSDDGGPWYCHKCQEKGNLWTMKKIMGDIVENTRIATGKKSCASIKAKQNVSRAIRPAFGKKTYKTPDSEQADRYHQALLKNPAALKYLDDRGINQNSVKRFNLGVCSKNGNQWLSIPHYQGGNLVNIKFRSLPPADKTFRRIPDCKSILFNVDALNKHDEIIITEGEIDAISLIQNGIENVVGTTVGAGAFDAEWIDQLKPVKRVASRAKEIDKVSFTAKTEALDPVTLVRVEAHRYGSGGETLLYFHGEYSRFDEIEKRQIVRS